jgi:AcrR family transcriptional regulator
VTRRDQAAAAAEFSLVVKRQFDNRLQATVDGNRTRAVLKKVAPPPEGTRDRILRTAIAEFSDKVYSGARILTICRKSRANPRMIYHYFAGKDGLYVAVLEHVLGNCGVRS